MPECEAKPRTSYFPWLRSQRGGHGTNQAGPTIGFFAQSLAAGGGELVELGPAVVFRGAPTGFEQPLTHQAEQRRIKCALFDEQRATGNLLDAQQNPVTVKRSERNSLENKEIESAGQNLRLVGHVSS